MFVGSVVVVLSCPREEVFAFIADARNRPRWDDSVDSEELTSPEPIGVGTTVRTKLRSMGRDSMWVAARERPSLPPGGVRTTPPGLRGESLDIEVVASEA